jgi:predicted kinase
MDLERLGAPGLADRFVTAYEAASETAIPRSLLHLYVAYRAQVRAMVTALRAEQEQAAGADATAASVDARRLLELCDRHLREATVRLVLVGGLPGTGKSTVARDLAEHFGWTVLRSDVVRKQRAGLPETEPAAAGFGEGIYGRASTDDTYRAMLAQASGLLGEGETVVLDASFTAGRHRGEARRVAAAASADLVEVRCDLDPVEAARRIADRRRRGGDASDADAGIAAQLAAAADPWPQADVLPTDGSPAQVAARAADLVARHW